GARPRAAAVPILRSASSAANRLRVVIARVNLPDAEPWEVIAEMGPARASLCIRGSQLALSEGVQIAELGWRPTATSARRCRRELRPRTASAVRALGANEPDQGWPPACPSNKDKLQCLRALIEAMRRITKYSGAGHPVAGQAGRPLCWTM